MTVTAYTGPVADDSPYTVNGYGLLFRGTRPYAFIRPIHFEQGRRESPKGLGAELRRGVAGRMGSRPAFTAHFHQWHPVSHSWGQQELAMAVGTALHSNFADSSFSSSAAGRK